MQIRLIIVLREGGTKVIAMQSLSILAQSIFSIALVSYCAYIDKCGVGKGGLLKWEMNKKLLE